MARLIRAAGGLVLAVIFATTAVGHPVAYPTDTLPRHHPTDPEFAAFDRAMESFMLERQIGAGTLAVSRQGELLWTQGFGLMGPPGSPVTPPDAMFRLASVTKPFTAALATDLVASGALRWTDPVFCLPPSPAPRCVLDLPLPVGGVEDPRIASITLANLREHTAGWDRDRSSDPMFQSRAIAASLGVPSPPTQTETATYMLGRMLDFAPGAKSVYSNFGYLLLGLAIEKATGQDYVVWLKHRLYGVPLAAAGPGDGVDLDLGRTLSHARNLREPAYDCPGLARGVFDSVPERYAKYYTCWSDGGWALEPMEAHGGLIASAPVVADFLDRYWITGEPRAPGATGSWHMFYGSLDGTWTLAYQHESGLNLVALFNKRDDAYRHNFHDIGTLLGEAARQYAAAHP